MTIPYQVKNQTQTKPDSTPKSDDKPAENNKPSSGGSTTPDNSGGNGNGRGTLPDDYPASDYVPVAPEEEYQTPEDATLFVPFKTERGVTTFTLGLGSNLSFIREDTETYESRDVPPSGYVYKLVRKTNTFSGIISH